MNSERKATFVSASQESSRMFRANWMEALSKVHFTVPLFLFLPVIAYCLYLASELPLPQIGLWWVIGVAIWSLTEYVLHRFVFHWQPPGKIGARIHFIFHGVHHDYPNDRLRLVMPPSLSIPLALLFYGLFRLCFGTSMLLYPFFAGFLVGYLFYDISHYAIHHFAIKGTIWAKIKEHHMHHHYAEPERGFGVSSPFWDHVFDTMFKRKK
jgi:4-hydroxysphinganine ceramide fatty acyl 2-hydroxylase